MYVFRLLTDGSLVLLRYQARLAARPLLTQSITTAVLFATGDTIAQQAVEKRGAKNHDMARTGRMALYGGSASPFIPLASIVTIDFEFTLHLLILLSF